MKKKILTPEKALETYIKQHNLRPSVERNMMLSFISQYDAHFTIPILIKEFGIPQHVSRASIYRNIELFLSAGIIIRHPLNEKEPIYELTKRADTHCHRICVKCNRIQEFTDAKAVQFLKYHRFKNFHTLHNQIYIYGICKKCQEGSIKSEKQTK